MKLNTKSRSRLVTTLLCIRQVSGSILCQNVGYPDWTLPCSSSVPQGWSWDYYLKTEHHTQ